MAERLLCKQDVTGSNPVVSTVSPTTEPGRAGELSLGGLPEPEKKREPSDGGLATQAKIGSTRLGCFAVLIRDVSRLSQESSCGSGVERQPSQNVKPNGGLGLHSNPGQHESV